MKFFRQGSITIMDINGTVHCKLLCSSRIGKSTRSNPVPLARFPMKKIAKFLDFTLKKLSPEYGHRVSFNSWEDFVIIASSASLGSEVFFVVDPKFSRPRTPWCWGLYEDRLERNEAGKFEKVLGSALREMQEELGITPTTSDNTKTFRFGPEPTVQP